MKALKTFLFGCLITFPILVLVKILLNYVFADDAIVIGSWDYNILTFVIFLTGAFCGSIWNVLWERHYDNE